MRLPKQFQKDIYDIQDRLALIYHKPESGHSYLKCPQQCGCKVELGLHTSLAFEVARELDFLSHEDTIERVYFREIYYFVERCIRILMRHKGNDELYLILSILISILFDMEMNEMRRRRKRRR
jgi:hypothetical protein